MMLNTSQGIIHLLEQGAVGDTGDDFATGLNNVQSLRIHLGADKNESEYHSYNHANDH